MLPVKLKMLGAVAPQYLQSYFGFSVPSYKACLPLLGPLGWREQVLPTKVGMLAALVPQYLQ
jgi:hypothetical protein